jgi:hypothetical protein
MNLRALMNPAGGIRYHLRALRFRGDQWQAFRWAIGEWLLDWQPKEPTLLLVGPSAGYCLQPFLFERFELVVCLEPDPVARYLFKRKLTKAPLDHMPKLEFIAQDHLVRNPERLPKLLEQLPATCVLFSNVLGQLRGLLNVDDDDGPEFARIKHAMAEAIRGRSWASFHDRVSGYARPTCEHAVTSNSRLSDAEILELLYSETPRNRRNRNLKLIDHLTAGLLPANLPHSYFSWELEPGRFHLIEAVSSPT